MYEESLPLVPSLLLPQIGGGNAFTIVCLFVSAHDNSRSYEWIFGHAVWRKLTREELIKFWK